MIKLKNMKKLNIIIILVCAVFLCACSDLSQVKDSGKMSIVTVNFPQYDIARAICGDAENIKMIIRPGAEVHGYEPTLDDILAIEQADVFIYNGGESDVWVEKILKGVDTSDTLVVNLMETEGINLYKEEHSGHAHTEDHNHNHDNTHIGKNYDEHIWTSPKNQLFLTKRVADELCAYNPEKTAVYRKNEAIYTDKIKTLDKELENIASESGHSFIAVADKFPFLYLAKDYDIDYIAGFTGCSAENDAGPRVLADMIEEIKHHSISSVFHVELSNRKMADAVSRHTGTRVKLLHSCQNVTREEFESGKSYVDIMKENIINLKEALL